ncbi:MAG TPA: pentapeptide repeat-containing protein [Methanothrix sp.]|nr:pentapeptide repeat-containing protein [Methanothrix sp.]
MIWVFESPWNRPARELNLRNTKFEGSVYLTKTHFQQAANFRYALFNQEAYFQDAKSHDLSFDYGQLSKEAFFDGARINSTPSPIEPSTISSTFADDDTAYYLLIENFKKQDFSDDANDCYYSYRYKHMWELLRQWKVDSWFFDLLAWATYGYGLRPVRPLGWSVLFILLGGAFFFVTKSISRSKSRPEPSGNRRRAIRGKDSPQRANEASIWLALLLSAT